MMQTTVCLSDGTDVLYNKFDVSGSSPPDNPPQHPNSGYSCVVATTGHWKVSQCSERHLVVCQSDHYIPTGIMNHHKLLAYYIFTHTHTHTPLRINKTMPIYTVFGKGATIFLSLTLTNIDGLSKFFHQHT